MKPLLEVKNLKKYFTLESGRNKKILAAVDDISFSIYQGKTTTGRTIIRLYNPTAGEILFNGVDIGKIPERQLKPFRKKIQMIFQDPYASLNCRMTVSEIISEGIKTHNILPKEACIDRVYELLEKVGLKKEHAGRYPHEFSGGQRQRIGIARALALSPDLIVCDEPISALDVSIQAQVVNMLEDLQQEFALTYLFIAHDLSMVRHISDRIAVMYLGKLVEMAESDELYNNPLHPYTQSLLSSIPVPDPRRKLHEKRIILKGDVGSPINPKPGCRFAPRCRFVCEECFHITPTLEEISNNHYVASLFTKKINGI